MFNHFRGEEKPNKLRDTLIEMIDENIDYLMDTHKHLIDITVTSNNCMIVHTFGDAGHNLLGDLDRFFEGVNIFPLEIESAPSSLALRRILCQKEKDLETKYGDLYSAFLIAQDDKGYYIDIRPREILQDSVVHDHVTEILGDVRYKINKKHINMPIIAPTAPHPIKPAELRGRFMPSAEQLKNLNQDQKTDPFDTSTTTQRKTQNLVTFSEEIQRDLDKFRHERGEDDPALYSALRHNINTLMQRHKDLINIEIFGDSLLVETFDDPSDALREDISHYFPKTPSMIIISKDDLEIMPAIRAIAHRMYIVEERFGDFIEGLAAEQDEDGAYISVLTTTIPFNEKTLRDELSLYFKDIRLEFDNINAAPKSQPASHNISDQHKPTL